MTTTQYLLTTCQVGAEAALKDELAYAKPPLRPSYGRPGFVTFKLPEPVDMTAALSFQPVFAQVWALSLGRVRDGEATDAERAKQAAAIVAQAEIGAPVHLHVWDRDQTGESSAARGPEPLGRTREAGGTRAARTGTAVDDHRAADALRGHLATAGVALHRHEPRVGDFVLDVVLVEEGEWWLGLHRHARGRGPLPGGRFVLDPLDGAPSRAWQKIDEAIACFELPLRAGDVVVEIGSAPGGIAMALLRRDVHVVGIDAAAMSPDVMSYARTHSARCSFRHVPVSADRVSRRDLPPKVDWIVSDINAVPPIALATVDDVVALLRDKPRGLVVTLKLGEPGLETRIAGYMERLRRQGYDEVACRQLPANRREVTLAAWSSRR
ncbi:MAG: SAM-dependent methyltransferase [Myxococcota bacterium]